MAADPNYSAPKFMGRITPPDHKHEWAEVEGVMRCRDCGRTAAYQALLDHWQERRAAALLPVPDVVIDTVLRS